jgi:hypothetical protein
MTKDFSPEIAEAILLASRSFMRGLARDCHPENAPNRKSPGCQVQLLLFLGPGDREHPDTPTRQRGIGIEDNL